MEKAQKLKPLKPSLREKNRYLAYEVISKEKMSKNQTEKLIYNGLLRLLGELSIAKAGLMFIKFNDNKGIIKVNNKYVNHLKSALALIKQSNLIIKSLGVSGILKKTQKYGL